MYLVFADWFAEKGNKSLLPPVITGQVERLMIMFTENDLMRIYGGVTVQEKNAINGERNLLEKEIYNKKDKKSVTSQYILFPKDYYGNITKIISKYDLRPFDRYSVLYGQGRTVKDEDPPQNADLQLLINFDNGHQINIETSEKSDIEMLRSLLNDLFNYNDSLFK